MKLIINYILILSMLLLSSCKYRGRTAIQTDPVHTVDHISEISRSTNSNGETSSLLVNSNGQFISKLKIASSFQASNADIREYLDTGMAVVDLYCQKFFKQVSTSQAHRQFLRSETNQVGGFISAILGITDAGSNVTGGFGAMFSFLDSSVENYDAAFLVAPDLPTVQDLISRTQRLLANELMLTENSYTYPEAERALVMYANNCTFNGIRSIVNKSLATTKPSPNTVSNRNSKPDSSDNKSSPDPKPKSKPVSQSTSKVLGIKFNNN